MKLLRRQFGANFVDLFSQSPTLVEDLKEVRHRGIRIRRIPGRDKAYSEQEKKLISIARDATTSFKLTSFAHEMYHILRGSVSIDRLPRGMTRRRFLSLILNEETDCIVHEMQVVDELLAAGVRFDDVTMRWYHGWRRGGRRYIRRKVAKTDNVFNQKMPDYYGGIYDKLVAEKKAA